MKHIIFAIVVLSLVACFNPTFGQGEQLFYETYNPGEVISLLDEGDGFFDLINLEQAGKGDAGIGSCPSEKAELLWTYVQGSTFHKQLPSDLEFAWGKQVGQDARILYALRLQGENTVPGKEDIRNVAIKESSRGGNYDLLVSFTDEGGEKWAAMTRANKGRCIAIVVDGEVISAPKVMAEIKQGKCRISGMMNETEANRLKTKLMDLP